MDWVPLTEAGNFFTPPVSSRRLWNWCRHGVRGAQLPHRRSGGRYLTTKAACLAFEAKLNGESPSVLPPECDDSDCRRRLRVKHGI